MPRLSVTLNRDVLLPASCCLTLFAAHLKTEADVKAADNNGHNAQCREFLEDEGATPVGSKRRKCDTMATCLLL